MGGSDGGKLWRAGVFAPDPRTGVRPVVVATRESTNAPPRRRLHILAIDDEPRFLESLALALGDDHDVETCTSATAALEVLASAAHSRRLDVVLCDLAMPVIDGATFYERVQAMGMGDRFVLMTGGAFTPRAAAFVESRACATISKPFLLEDLLALLDRVAPASAWNDRATRNVTSG